MWKTRGATEGRPYSSKLVDLVRFERTASTFAESRSNSTELQVQIGASRISNLAEQDFKFGIHLC